MNRSVAATAELRVIPGGAGAAATALAPAAPLVETENLRKYFSVGRGAHLKAVDDVSLAIQPGEVFGLVGESGCGKTTLGRTLAGLYTPTGGSIKYRSRDVSQRSAAVARELSRRIQMIFQDPYASLNPRMTVADIIAEPIDIHRIARGPQRLKRVYHLLETVGLHPDHANRFPHEFSGGQRQRIGIARALAVDPEFIIADEPISALDVSIQAQVVNLLEQLKRERGLTYLFIAHDLAMVRHISDRVGVMYLGQLVEVAAAADLYRRPLHPYTEALLSAIPVPDPATERRRNRIILVGDVPSPVNPPQGCRFAGRCPKVFDRCRTEAPVLKTVAGSLQAAGQHPVMGSRQVACHLY